MLSISEAPGEFAFALDAVLTPENPRYQHPKPDEQYCYVLGKLEFHQVTAVKWLSRSAQQYTDASGAVDLGNIDSRSFAEGLYVAVGDWGQVEIQSTTEPQFVFD